jgi:hypothetical protein
VRCATLGWRLQRLRRIAASYAEGVVRQSPASRSARWVRNKETDRTPTGFYPPPWLVVDGVTGVVERRWGSWFSMTETQRALRDVGLGNITPSAYGRVCFYFNCFNSGRFLAASILVVALRTAAAFCLLSRLGKSGSPLPKCAAVCTVSLIKFVSCSKRKKRVEGAIG